MHEQSDTARMKLIYEGGARPPGTVVDGVHRDAGSWYAHIERTTVIASVLQEQDYFPLWDRQILQIQCGPGDMLQSMKKLGAAEENLYGIDRVPRHINEARRRLPEAHLFCESLVDLQFHDARFDLIICSAVFSAISDSQQSVTLASEVRRILQPGGAVIWYDLRYPHPRNRLIHAVRRPSLRRLFDGCEMALRTCTVVPPLARSLGRYTDALYPVLASIRPFRSHYAGLIIPR